MGEILWDGTGGKWPAKIDSENHLHTTATVESMMGHRSHYDATAFGVTTPRLTITTTGGRILYLKNTSSSHDLVISNFWFGWNGGSTNFDRSLYGILYFGDATPSGNNTASAMGVLNRKTNNSADVTVQYWDEVGDGMTCTGGTAAFYWIQDKVHNHVDVQSAVILGINDTLSVNLQAGEAGEATINMFGFMRES